MAFFRWKRIFIMKYICCTKQFHIVIKDSPCQQRTFSLNGNITPTYKNPTEHNRKQTAFPSRSIVAAQRKWGLRYLPPTWNCPCSFVVLKHKCHIWWTFIPNLKQWEGTLLFFMCTLCKPSIVLNIMDAYWKSAVISLWQNNITERLNASWI